MHIHIGTASARLRKAGRARRSRGELLDSSSLAGSKASTNPDDEVRWSFV